MLRITVIPVERFNSETCEFIPAGKPETLVLEHSLLSISKWEQKWKKPMPLIQHIKSMAQISVEELRDYVRCMTLNPITNQNIYDDLSVENVETIMDYIKDEMTATKITPANKPGARKPRTSVSFITNELIYCWMNEHNIPKECEKWHINRLLTLINVHNERESAGDGSNKMSKSQTANYYRELARARRGAKH